MSWLLKDILRRWQHSKDEPYVHKQETADELFDMVVSYCQERADCGCSTALFEWPYVRSDNKEIWLEQHAIAVEVADRLKCLGFKASSNNKFPEPRMNAYGETEIYEGEHSIYVEWRDAIKDAKLI